MFTESSHRNYRQRTDLKEKKIVTLEYCKNISQVINELL